MRFTHFNAVLSASRLSDLAGSTLDTRERVAVACPFAEMHTPVREGASHFESNLRG